MVTQVAPPGVEYTHHTQLSADEARVMGQVLHRCRRGAEEQVVNEPLAAPGYFPEFAGQSERDQEVTDGQEHVLLLLQPLLCLAVLALGTMAIPARMILVFRLSALLAGIDVPSQSRSPTSLYRSHHLMVAGQHPLS